MWTESTCGFCGFNHPILKGFFLLLSFHHCDKKILPWRTKGNSRSGNTETKHPVRRAISDEPSKQPGKKEVNPFFPSLPILVISDFIFDHSQKSDRKGILRSLKIYVRAPVEPLLAQPGQAWPGQDVSLGAREGRIRVVCSLHLKHGVLYIGVKWVTSQELHIMRTICRELQRSDSEM